MKNTSVKQRHQNTGFLMSPLRESVDRGTCGMWMTFVRELVQKVNVTARCTSEPLVAPSRLLSRLVVVFGHIHVPDDKGVFCPSL